MRGHRATSDTTIIWMIEVPFAVVVNEHRAINLAPEVPRLVRERTCRAVACEHIVPASSGRGTHIKESVPVNNLWSICDGRRLVGAADVCLRPFHQVFSAPAIDISVASADIKIVVTPVLHHVGVAQAAVL